MHTSTSPATAPLPLTVDDVRRAADLIAGQIVRTPMSHSRTLSSITGASVWLKLDNLQFTASFKERGALTRLLQLSDAQRRAGVIAMSAGNHAQGVAYHAARLGIPATIVMPLYTPNTKVSHTRAHGANVILHGRTLDESFAHAQELRQQHGYTFIHPFDDPFIIAGQGTVALEMLADEPTLQCLVVPIGGGGLISGMAVAAKAINPDIRIIGVQSALYPGVQAFHKGELCPGTTPTIAEGIAVRAVGEITGRIIDALVDQVLLVDETAIEEAITLLIDVEKTVAEGAGAVGLAALLRNREMFANQRVGLVVCGGNIDQRLLASILTRSLVRQNRLVKVRMIGDDRPGLLCAISRVMADAQANIIEVLHNRTSPHVPVKSAEFDITIETRDSTHTQQVLAALAAAGFQAKQV